MEYVFRLSALVLFMFLCGCNVERQSSELVINVASSGPQCIVVYELQRQSPIGMATWSATHMVEVEGSQSITYRASLCPSLQIDVPGGETQFIEQDGGPQVIDLASGPRNIACADPILSVERAQIAELQTSSRPFPCEMSRASFAKENR